MNPLEKSLALLQKYLKETPKEVLQQEFDELNQAHFEGPTISEYLRLFEQHNAHLNHTPVIQLNMAYFKEPIWNRIAPKVQVSTLLLLNMRNPVTEHQFNYFNNMALAA